MAKDGSLVEHSLYDELRTLRSLMVRQEDGRKYYRLVEDFSQSSMSQIAEGMGGGMFRPFVPVKPDSHRRLNACYGAAFDSRQDSLMDYPTIVSAKLGGLWTDYNMLVSVHVTGCPLHCWHCFVDECLMKACGRCPLEQIGKCKQYGRVEQKPNVTARQVIDGFLGKRPSFAGILRITGGEPLLLPDLISECLKVLEDEGLSDKVFVWTETNLVPLLVDPNTNRPFAEDWGLDLATLARYRNFCIHPCLHGLNTDTMRKVTGHGIELPELIAAMKRLIDAGIDVYPSFITEANPPESIPIAFGELKAVDHLLPLRVALVRYDRYPPVEERLDALRQLKREPTPYSHEQAIETWDGLLKKTYGIPYAQVPRHVVPCPSNETHHLDVLSEASGGRTLVFFKSVYRPEYKDALVKAVCLPPGLRFSIAYDLRHLSPSAVDQVRNGRAPTADAMFIFVDHTRKPTDAEWARRFLPLRKATLEKVDYNPGASWAMFQFQLGSFLGPTDTWERASDEIACRYSGSILPNEKHALFVLPGAELVWTRLAENPISGWESVVDGLSRFGELKSIPFCTFASLHRENGDKVSWSDPICLKAGKAYSLSLVSHVPQIDTARDEYGDSVMIEVVPGSSAIQLRSPSPLIATKYGQYSVSFECPNSLSASVASLTIRPIGERKRGTSLTIPATVEGSRGHLWIAGAGIVAGLVMSILPDILTTGKFTFCLKVAGGTLTPLSLLWLTLKYTIK